MGLESGGCKGAEMVKLEVALRASETHPRSIFLASSTGEEVRQVHLDHGMLGMAKMDELFSHDELRRGWEFHMMMIQGLRRGG